MTLLFNTGCCRCGFSLIEVLVVMALLGILALILIPALSKDRSGKMTKIFEIGLLPNIDGETPATLQNNWGVIQIAALSGRISVYRP